MRLIPLLHLDGLPLCAQRDEKADTSQCNSQREGEFQARHIRHNYAIDTLFRKYVSQIRSTGSDDLGWIDTRRILWNTSEKPVGECCLAC